VAKCAYGARLVQLRQNYKQLCRYREHTERVPSRLELFFDLVFVAIAHQLSDAAAGQPYPLIKGTRSKIQHISENPNGWSLLKFILTF
jgi:hypothetical protein